MRKAARHIQVSLANEIGVHLPTVTRWEIGEVAGPIVVELALRHIVKPAKKGRR